jgi:hypothetical protein
MRVLATTLAALTLTPIAAHGQSPPALPRLDTTASIGWFTANHADRDDCCSRWSSSLFKGIGAGYYWTDHLKSELEIAWPGPTRAFTYSNARPAATGVTTYTYENHVYSGVKISASQAYQFGRNAVFHPFAGAGVDIDREHDAVTRSTQTGSVLTRVDFRERERHARPFVTTGFKAYFSERAFFRTELKASFSRQLEQMIWKSGVGVDFGPAARRPASTHPRAPERPRGQDAPDLWRAYAAKLPIGSTVRVAPARGESFIASLLAVDDTGVLLKPKTRMPEPARHLAFDALERLELYTHGGPVEQAGAIAAGVGAGSGVFFLLLALLSRLD